MTENAHPGFDDVLKRLRTLGRRLRLHLLVDGLASLSMAVLAAVVVTYSVDRSVWLARDMRLVQLVTLLAALGALAWWRIGRPLGVKVRDVDLAILVERRHPQLQSRLVSAVEFSGPRAATGEAGGSAQLMAAVMDQARRQSAAIDFGRILSARRFRQRATVICACVVLFSCATLVARGTVGLWFRRNVLLQDVQWPLRNRLFVEGLKEGRIIVPRGDDLTITAIVEPGYEAPQQCYVEFEGEDGLRGREQMPAIEDTPEAQVRFTYTFERLDQTLVCRVAGGDFRTEPFTVQVIERPRITQVVIGIVPPAYTHLDPYELRVGQTVADALKGSRIRLRIQANKPIASATLVRQSGGQETDVAVAETTDRHEYAAADLPDASGTYCFRLVDALGISNISDRSPPLRVSVRLVADKPPSVKIRVKGAGEMITPAAMLPVEMEFLDTYGMASARLTHTLARKDSQPVAQDLKGFEPGVRVFSQSVEWSAPAHGLVEGDRLSLQATATDFDNISGPNLGESPATVLRVVSREELAAELNRREQEYRQDFERLLHQQEELYGELLTLAQAQSAPSADTSRRLGQLARLQRDLGGRVSSLRLQFEQILSELRINRMSSPPTEARLGGGVTEPMNALGRSKMPGAADGLDGLSREMTAERMQAARGSQAEIVAEMQRILANMLKWEGFQEAVSLLREVMKMQGNLNQETEQRIEAEVFGTQPVSGPSK